MLKRMKQLVFLQKDSANSRRRKAEIGTSRKEGILNPMIQIPLNILALVVVKQGTSKQIVQAIKQRTNLLARKLKEAREEELTSHGKKMKYLQPAALQLRMRKTICAS